MTRFTKQQAIEDAITKLHPDACEASEILDAITSSLKARYEERAVDVVEQAKALREALGELDHEELWRYCGFCGCGTNARLLACCGKGREADIKRAASTVLGERGETERKAG